MKAREKRRRRQARIARQQERRAAIRASAAENIADLLDHMYGKDGWFTATNGSIYVVQQGQPVAAP